VSYRRSGRPRAATATITLPRTSAATCGPTPSQCWRNGTRTPSASCTSTSRFARWPALRSGWPGSSARRARRLHRSRTLGIHTTGVSHDIRFMALQS